MKKLLFFLGAAGLIQFSASAQTYNKIYDKPTDVIKGHIGVELYGVDVGFNNIDGSMIFAVGVNAAYPVIPKLLAEANVRMPLLKLVPESPSYMMEGGVAYELLTKEKPKEVKVILKYKETDLANGYESRETEYVNIQANVQNSLTVRGGVYLKTTGFKPSETTVTAAAGANNISHNGVYLGLGQHKKWFLHLNENNKGKETKFAAGNYFRPYADVLLLPTSMNSTPDKTKSEEMIGWRVGFKWYRNPFTRDQNFGRRANFFANSTVYMEGGQRPEEGFFITGGFSFMLFKFK